MDVSLTREEIELICYALNMRRNFIETGDCIMSADYADKCDQQVTIKVLSTDQMRFICRLEDLQAKLRAG